MDLNLRSLKPISCFWLTLVLLVLGLAVQFIQPLKRKNRTICRRDNAVNPNNLILMKNKSYELSSPTAAQQRNSIKTTMQYFLNNFLLLIISTLQKQPKIILQVICKYEILIYLCSRQ